MRIVVVCFLFIFIFQGGYAQPVTQEQYSELKQEIKALRERIEKLEAPKGLKTEDLKNTSLNSIPSGNAPAAQPTLTPEQLKQIEETQKLIQKNDQEQKKLLEQLEHEN